MIDIMPSMARRGAATSSTQSTNPPGSPIVSQKYRVWERYLLSIVVDVSKRGPNDVLTMFLKEV